MNERKEDFTSHISELRSRIIRSVLFLVVATAVALAFYRPLLGILIIPIEDASAQEDILADEPSEPSLIVETADGTQMTLGDIIESAGEDGFRVEGNMVVRVNPGTSGRSQGEGLVFTELTEFWGAALKVSILAGIAVSTPFFLFQMVRFAAPGLEPHERRWLWFLIPGSLLSFLAGAAFGYFVAIPPAVDFLTSFGGDIATPTIRIGSYVNLMTTLLLWLGAIFELPIVMFFLAKIGVVTPEWLRSKRRWVLVLAFVAGAIITPTFDPVNQTLVAGPIIILFELGYWLSRLAVRGKRESRQAVSPTR
ncbi:MAG: twin-arginine translocase subunit TatC [Chloroflexota bacterium]